MADPTPPPADIDAVLARTRHLLLDFDGVVCDPYANQPPAMAADRHYHSRRAHPRRPHPAHLPGLIRRAAAALGAQNSMCALVATPGDALRTAAATGAAVIAYARTPSTGTTTTQAAAGIHPRPRPLCKVFEPRRHAMAG